MSDVNLGDGDPILDNEIEEEVLRYYGDYDSSNLRSLIKALQDISEKYPNDSLKYYIGGSDYSGHEFCVMRITKELLDNPKPEEK